MKKGYLLLMAIVLITFACTRYDYSQTSLQCKDGSVLECPAEAPVEEGDLQEIPEEEEVEETPEVETPEEEEVVETPEEGAAEEETADFTVKAGELLVLDLLDKVQDPDGDEITLTYSEPFNEKGEWQTKAGDAGLRTFTVTADDGKTKITKEFTVLVTADNMPPVIDISDTVELDEGKKIRLQPSVSDPDGDEVTVTFSGWMDSHEYATTFEDAGEYEVKITADDGKAKSEKTIKIVVKDVNRAPVLELKNVEQGMVELTVGDSFTIEADVTDADGDDVTVTFGEPFDGEGKWTAEEAGEHKVMVTASDEKDETSQEILVVVKEKDLAPVFKPISDVVINVGENVKDYVKPEANDPEGKEVTYAVSGWLTDLDHVVTDDDAGEHSLTVTYTDGTLESEDTVKVTVNRAPQFNW